MDKKLLALNLMKTRKTKKNHLGGRTVFIAGLLTAVFLLYKFEVWTMI